MQQTLQTLLSNTDCVNLTVMRDTAVRIVFSRENMTDDIEARAGKLRDVRRSQYESPEDRRFIGRHLIQATINRGNLLVLINRCNLHIGMLIECQLVFSMKFAGWPR